MSLPEIDNLREYNNLFVGLEFNLEKKVFGKVWIADDRNRLSQICLRYMWSPSEAKNNLSSFNSLAYDYQNQLQGFFKALKGDVSVDDAAKNNCIDLCVEINPNLVISRLDSDNVQRTTRRFLQKLVSDAPNARDSELWVCEARDMLSLGGLEKGKEQFPPERLHHASG